MRRSKAKGGRDGLTIGLIKDTNYSKYAPNAYRKNVEKCVHYNNEKKGNMKDQKKYRSVSPILAICTLFTKIITN